MSKKQEKDILARDMTYEEYEIMKDSNIKEFIQFTWSGSTWHDIPVLFVVTLISPIIIGTIKYKVWNFKRKYPEYFL